MRFEDIRSEYYTHTGKASDIIRQLCYAGFAMIWVFKQGTAQPEVPTRLLPAAALLALALTCDMLQYITLARGWNRVAVNADAEVQRRKPLPNGTKAGDVDVDVSLGVNDWGVRLYNWKACSTVLAYVWLIAAILSLIVWK